MLSPKIVNLLLYIMFAIPAKGCKKELFMKKNLLVILALLLGATLSYAHGGNPCADNKKRAARAAAKTTMADPGEAERWLSITAGRGDKEAVELLAEASAARRSEESEWKWRQRRQAILREQWYRHYHYYGHWRQGRWYYR